MLADALDYADPIAAFQARCEADGIDEATMREQIRRGMAGIDLARMRCESPIEEAMLPSLVFQDYGPRFEPYAVISQEPREHLTAVVQIVPQFELPGARFDFMLIALRKHEDGFVGRKMVALECDGKDFHYAPKDAVRDRAYAGAGIVTVRASGSEIHRNPRAVAERVARHFIEWAG